MPVIIYAKVNFGSYPVALAQVKAVVTSPKQATTEMRLIDSGLADPDITQYDGIYSGYFMQFDGEGKYDVHVTVSREEKTFVLKDGTDRCCGKQVEANELTDAPLFTTSSTVSFSAKSAKPEHGYKPSRIIDLRVDSFDLPKSLVLKWTAPGGGKASTYEFKFCNEPKNCNEDGKLPDWVKPDSSEPAPKTPGETEEMKFELSPDAPTDLTVFLGLVSVTPNGNSSDLSNLVRFRVSANVQPPTPTTITDKDKKPQKSTVSGQIIGGILAGVFLLLVLISITYFCFYKRRRQEESASDLTKPEPPKADVDGVDISGPFSGREGSLRRIESFPVVLYAHDQIGDPRIRKTDSPLYRADIAPKQWVSLDVLSNRHGTESAVTISVDDVKSVSGEIKQLDDVSQTSHDPLEKIARF